MPIYNSACSSIKRSRVQITVDQGSKGALRPDQAIKSQFQRSKTFDRRRRSKYRAYSGDYPLYYGLATSKMIGQSYVLHCRVIESQYKLNLASCPSHTVIQ